MKISTIDKSIIFLFSILLVVDSLNGILLLNKVSGISLSQLVKFPLLLLMLIRILYLNKTYILYILIIFSILICSVFINYIKAVDIVFFVEIILILKLLVIPISVFYFASLKNLNYYYYYKSITNIFIISFVVLSFNIFLSLIGIGYHSYRGEIGNKGFFYAGNELSALYLILTSYLLYYTLKKYSIKVYVLLSAISLYIGISISTKVSMFSIFIIIILTPLVSIKFKKDSKLISKAFVFLLTIGIMSVLLFNTVISSSAFERWVHFFKVYDYDYISILLSGRNKTLIDSFNMNDAFFEPFNLFFGYSYSGLVNNLQQSTIYRVKLNEMDFFDIYFIYGLLGLFSVLSVWIISLYHFFYSNKKNLILLITVLLILFISFLSGHVLYSGLSGPFIGIYLSLMFQKNIYKKMV